MRVFRLTSLALALSLLSACSSLPTSGNSRTDTTADTPVAVSSTDAPSDATTAEPEVAVVQSETERLNAWFAEVEQQGLARSPVAKAYRGIIDRDYDRWDNPSDEFAVETYQLEQRQLAGMLDSFDVDALDEQGRLSWRLFIYERENDARNHPYRRHGYLFNQMFGPHAQVPVFLVNIHQINSPETAEAWIGRAAAVPDNFEQLLLEADARFEMGVQPPDWVYPQVIETARNTISGAPFDEGEPSMVWTSFKNRVEALAIDPSRKQDLLHRGREALQSWVPAYHALIDLMQEHQSRTAEGDGAWRLPNGADFYANRLRHYTTTDLDAETIHQIGLDNVARIHEEMRAIMEQVGFGGSLNEFFAFMRNSERFYYPNTDAGRDAYLSEARALIERMTERLPEYFATLPKHELVVRRVEPFRERSAGKAFYQRPAADGSRPGVYYANLFDMNEMPTYQMEALAYHEGSPGHHMQLAIMTDLELPAFRRFGGYSAYTEGWGLYTEFLPLEMGFYEDPYSNFGRLAMELWRAARLVVDTGLHHKRWSREEAIEYLVENTPNPEGDAIKAIERYAVLPGQATAYMIGMLKILELRDEAELALGNDFDIRQFHDVILRNGAVPLSVLEGLVNDWVAKQQRRTSMARH
jgi:uncharacterized protein (DUF885 family)